MLNDIETPVFRVGTLRRVNHEIKCFGFYQCWYGQFFIPRCELTGRPCSHLSSHCPRLRDGDPVESCVAVGPGGLDIWESNRAIARMQADMSLVESLFFFFSIFIEYFFFSMFLCFQKLMLPSKILINILIS